ncbi:MAG: 16S rRNA (adenine(1518)-N(6)/adenine(1519)-N(6))-dimethyltransferase RsmA [Candidatus Aminicenantes bacterium]|jgi:16S rRNA (adenine1518-N6/adenine1519-N6)-dimethyltransferase
MTHRKTKILGQHFLKNPHVLKKIIACISPQNEDVIIEIGPGKGALTIPLTEWAGEVVAIEKDRALAFLLKEKKIPNLSIREGDFLKVDFKSLISEKKPLQDKPKIVGNLPYSISSPILFKIYEHKELLSFCVFLLQLEVAERICAAPGSKKFAPISILFQNEFETHIRARIGPQSFSPPPKVMSALLSLKKREKPLYELTDEDKFRRFLKTSFQSRRKTLFNNLIMGGYHRDHLDTVFQNLDIEKKIRPEQLSIKGFHSLFETLMASSSPID